MFCPKCATDNLEGARFCRSCGANVSLLPQALSGQLPLAEPEVSGEGRDDYSRRGRRRRHKQASIDEGIKRAISGLGFICVAFGVFYFAPAGRLWWFWMF